jgi:hypothetical protein
VVDRSDDFDVEKPPEDFTPPPARGRTFGIVAAAIIVVAAAVWYWVVHRPPAPAQAPTIVTEEPAAGTTVAPGATREEAVEPIDLPSLDESDGVVRQLVEGLSAHPQLAAWLAGTGLIRTFAVVVDNVAEGRSPVPHLGFLRPKQPFRAAGQGDRLRIDPRSYERYRPVAEVVTSLDATACARAYLTLKPRITEAYRELGHPGDSFDATLERAIRHLLATPVLTGEVSVVDYVASFRYADPDVEALSAAQKQLLRMGPDGVTAVQGKLREIAAALGMPQS